MCRLSGLTFSAMRPLRVFLPVLAALSLWAASPVVSAAPEGTGLPLPRFVNLRAGEVNMRTGPGVQYPVEWVYQRQNLPVEIVAEHRTWRKVRDWQGTQGWVHQSMLGGRRTFVVTGAVRTLRDKADARSTSVARAEPGVVGRLLECPKDSGWCKVEIEAFQGWLRRVDFWGVNPNEVVK